jgi:Relaxase/Mobilisation nuclease domain
MILKGNQRANGAELARHLMKDENEHVEIHEIRGLAAETIKDAFADMECEAVGTRCKEPLYAFSINPPPGETITIQDLEQAAELAESRLGLNNQPRVFVLHEKQGRLHAHVVWSRIDRDTGKAIQLSHDRRKLQTLSRELYLQHGWEMPSGIANNQSLNENFSHAEAMQYKRTDIHPEKRKEIIRNCWQRSTNTAEFQAALERNGFKLCSGNRDYLVISKMDGEAVNLTRALNIKIKELRPVLGDKDQYPKLETAKAELAQSKAEAVKNAHARMEEAHRKERKPIIDKRQLMIERQKLERNTLRNEQMQKQVQAERDRADRYRKGIMGLWDRVTGRHGETMRKNALDRERENAQRQSEMMALRNRHLEQSRSMAHQMAFIRERQQAEKLKFQRLLGEDLSVLLSNKASQIENRVKTQVHEANQIKAPVKEQARQPRGLSL